jgi:hypothetical protein
MSNEQESVATIHIADKSGDETDAIIGGIEALGSDSVETIVSGGNRVVVGHSALDAMRDRAIYLKSDLESFDHRKLLKIIGMSPPIAFGIVSFDDGETSFIVSSKKERITPDDKLLKDLSARLAAEPDEIARWMTRNLNLEQPIWLAMGECVDEIIRNIDASLTLRGKKPIDMIYVAPELGCLIPFTTCGKLETSAVGKSSNLKTFKAFILYLLNICASLKCISPNHLLNKESIAIPELPKLNESTITSMKGKKTECKTVSEYVRAIIMRENDLTEYLVLVERYNISVAKGIQEYTSRITEYFAKPTDV